jgi:hypothetical protein
MRNFIERWKARWAITSDGQLILINFIFAITGSSVLYVRRFIYSFIGVTADTALIYKILLYVVTVTPAYFIMLLTIGTLLGQFRFFWSFEKRVFCRMFCRNKKR